MATAPSLIDRFGVEIEALLLFQESDLVPVLQRFGLTSQDIVKKPKPRKEVRSNLGVPKDGDYSRIATTRPSYRGWALRYKSTDPTEWYPAPAEQCIRSRLYGKHRTYWVEPLHIAEKVLQDEGLVVQVKVDAQDPSPFTSWRLVNDYTLIGLSRKQKLHQLRTLNLANKAEAENWDTAGIELVTLPLAVDDNNSFAEMHRYLTALDGHNQKPRILPSKYAGLHVHIGFRTPTTNRPLVRLVQHLGYILFQFELVLAQCFPPHRNANNYDFDRNLGAEDLISSQDTQSNRRAVEDSFKRPGEDIPLREVSNRIFSTDSISTLSKIMMKDAKNKGFRANFKPLAAASEDLNNTKRTIEFRAHESTTSGHDVEQWVRLLVAICRTAENKANSTLDISGQPITQPYSPATQRSKYAVQTDQALENTTITDFFDFLNLPGPLRAHWQARWDKYHNDTDLATISPAFSGPPWNESSSDDDDDDDDSDSDLGILGSSPTNPFSSSPPNGSPKRKTPSPEPPKKKRRVGGISARELRSLGITQSMTSVLEPRSTRSGTVYRYLTD